MMSVESDILLGFHPEKEHGIINWFVMTSKSLQCLKFSFSFPNTLLIYKKGNQCLVLIQNFEVFKNLEEVKV